MNKIRAARFDNLYFNFLNLSKRRPPLSLTFFV